MNTAAIGPRRNLRLTAAICGVFVVGMVGMAFAAVPLYRIFCDLTGYGGTTQKAERAPDGVLAREVTVRFDANIADDLGWTFRPETREVKVRIGEVTEVTFLAANEGSEATSGVATFHVTPGDVGAYFDKLSCFCFEEQTLAAGESRHMPVLFFLDPALVKDHELDSVDTITLSYTFYPAPTNVAPPKPLAAAARRGSAL